MVVNSSLSFFSSDVVKTLSSESLSNGTSIDELLDDTTNDYSDKDRGDGFSGFGDGDASSGYGDVSSDKDHGDESSDYSNEFSEYGDGFLPTSPIDIPIGRRRLCQRRSGLTMRDSLLDEAWERKKELAMQDEPVDLKEYAMPHPLGRSSSDCGTAPCIRKHQLLERSVSDVSPMLTRTRARSLTDEDFEELKGFIDLGFHFDETSLPALGHTLPALEVYCAVAQNLQESPYPASPARSCGSIPSTSPWRISSPGDTPEEVKERLRHWAQAVACNARLCY